MMVRLLWSASVVAMVATRPAFATEVEIAETGASEASAIATTEVVGRATIYRLAYFDQYSPTNALDIAQRVPGFQLDLGPAQNGNQPEVRGFAGTAGNVVINGARPSSKSESLETLLRRIPAKRVARVEVQPGDLYGSDYAGKSQVLNIVMSDEGGLSGNVTTSIRHRYPDKWLPEASANALWKKGDVSVNLAAGYQNRDVREEGFDRVSTIDGDEIEYRRKFNDTRERAPFGSASVAWEEDATHSVRANIRFERNPFVLKQRNRVTPIDAAAHNDTLILDYFNNVFELGGDVTRPLAGGAVKLIGLATRRDRDNREAYYGNDPAGTLVDGFEQRARAERDETLGRLSWTRGNLAGFSVEIGAEYVFNILRNDLDLDVIEEDGSRTPIDLPIAKATISEKRAQFFANIGHPITATLRADATLAYETSKLKVRGDALADRALSFFKPGLTLDWRPTGGWHVQASLKRTVAQLDFYDFVSSAELANDRVNGGNANLLPQRAWEARLTVEKPVLGDGLIKLEAGVDRISQLQDRILTEDGFDAPGNLGSGRRRFAALTLDAPLAFTGLKGARLKLFGRAQSTSVFDPVSLDKRRFSGFFPKWEATAEFRHDMASFAYGTSLSYNSNFCFYRIDEIDCNAINKPFVSAFVEFRPSPQTTVTFNVDNITNQHGTRSRYFAFPNRSQVPSLLEYRDRNNHRTFGLTIKQQFG